MIGNVFVEIEQLLIFLMNHIKIKLRNGYNS
jgi:hypothetical protein